MRGLGGLGGLGCFAHGVVSHHDVEIALSGLEELRDGVHPETGSRHMRLFDELVARANPLVRVHRFPLVGLEISVLTATGDTLRQLVVAAIVRNPVATTTAYELRKAGEDLLFKIFSATSRPS